MFFSGMCLLSRDLLFLGSCIGDLFLVKFMFKEELMVFFMFFDVEDESEDEVMEKLKGKRFKSGGAVNRKRVKIVEALLLVLLMLSFEDDDDEFEVLFYGMMKMEIV